MTLEQRVLVDFHLLNGKRGVIKMKKAFVLPEHTYEAEVFDNSNNTWRTIIIKAPSEMEAMQKIYLEMNEDDILLKVRNERGYLV